MNATKHTLLAVMLAMLTTPLAALAADEDVEKLMQRLDALEAKVSQQAQVIEGLKTALALRADEDGEDEGEENEGLERLRIGLGATQVLQGSSGVKKSLAATGNAAHGTVSFDVEMEADLGEDTTGFIHWEAGNGAGLDATLPTLSTLNSDADNDTNIRLTELVVSRAFSGWTFQTGQVDVGTVFDGNAVANDETANFLSSALVNNLAVEFPVDNGLGAMASIDLGERAALHLGLADNDTDWDNLWEDVFAMAQLDLGATWNGRPGTYRLYLWQNGADHTDLQNAARTQEKNRGFGVSLDQMLDDRWTVFSRYGQQRESVSAVDAAFTLGMSVGSLLDEENGELGLGVTRAMTSRGKQLADAVAGIQTGDETLVEAYFRFALTDFLELSPHVQWVQNPNADRANDTLWVFGTRMQVSF